MKLSELLLNRYLYKDTSQDSATKDSTSISIDATPEEPPAIASGGAAQDINTSNVTINGSQLTPGTIPQATLDVSNWGWGQTCTFTSASSTTVTWGSGIFTSAGGDSYSISPGTTGVMAAKTYIYLDLNVSDTAYQITTTPANAVGIGKVLVAVAQNGSTNATYNLSEASQIVGDNILANTINASKLTVGQLSAISADLGSITAGTITGATIRTSASGLRVEISGDDLWSYDSSDVLRMQLSGDSLAFSNDSGVLVGTLVSTTNSLGIFAGTNKSIYSVGDGTGNAGLAIDSTNYFYASGSLGYNVSARHIIPTSTSVNLGSSGSHFGTIYVDNIVGASSGANTALSNLASVAINTSLKSDSDATDDLGSSSISWRNLYLGGTGNLYFNNEIVFDFSTSSDTTWFGSSGMTAFSPYSSLGADLGSTSDRWSTIYGDELDLTGGISAGGDIDMNGNDINLAGSYLNDVRRIYFETGLSTNPTTSGQIVYYDGASKGFRGYVNGFRGQFDMTAV